MRIAVFTDVFLEVPGGICSSIRAQRDGLVKYGHQVTIFCPGWRATKEHYAIVDGKVDEGVIIVPTHKWLKLGGAPLSKSPEAVQQFIETEIPNFGMNFDLVHVHYEASCSLAGMLLARKFGLGLIQTMHGREDMAVAMNVPHPLKTLAGSLLNYLHGKYLPHPVKVERDAMVGVGDEYVQRGERGFDFGLAPTVARAQMWTMMVNHANFADAVVVPSAHFARKLKHYGMTTPTAIISNGVADEMVERFDQGGVKVRKMGDDGVLRLLWNSRVSSEKRIMPMLEAVSLMKRPVELAVFGDGNEFKKAQRFVRNHRLKNQVKFYGRVSHDEILEKMRDAHLSVMGSFGFDNQSMILLEAEATGLPTFFVDPDMAEVVPAAGAINCVKELIKLGRWTPGRRSAPTAAEMAEVLDSIDDGRIRKMSEAMLKHRKEVLQSTQLEKLLKLYDSWC